MHYLLFTGHMIDKAGRDKPRFPADKVPLAKIAISKAVQTSIEKTGRPVTGIAGGACGGDLLFHEACEELGIETELYLALPKDEFIEASVAFAGVGWIERFNHFYHKLKHHVLAETRHLPALPEENIEYSVWEKANLWMLDRALSNGGKQMTLIALWDGKGGDGPGGTEHLVKEAQERGATITIIDTNKLFGI